MQKRVRPARRLTLCEDSECRSKATVFIVDDEPEVRKSLATVVKLMGLETLCFDSASAFLAAYDPARAGCLLVDLRMPEVSGIELLERLAQRHWRIPAVCSAATGTCRRRSER